MNVITIQQREINNSVPEKVIEDILTTDKSIFSEVLSLTFSDLSLIARQKIIPSGKLDMLYLYKDEMLLIELKTVPFYNPSFPLKNSNHWQAAMCLPEFS